MLFGIVPTPIGHSHDRIFPFGPSGLRLISLRMTWVRGRSYADFASALFIVPCVLVRVSGFVVQSGNVGLRCYAVPSVIRNPQSAIEYRGVVT